MHATVLESFLSLQRTVKVKGCIFCSLLYSTLLKKNSSEIKKENVSCGHIWDGYALQKTYHCFHPFPLHASDHHGVLWWVELDLFFFSCRWPLWCSGVRWTWSSPFSASRWMTWLSWLSCTLSSPSFASRWPPWCSGLSWTISSPSSVWRWPPWRSGGS